MTRTSGSRVMDDASAEGGSYECSTPPRPVDRLAAVRSLVGSTIRDVEMDLIRETLRVHGGKRIVAAGILGVSVRRSEEHTSELQSLMRISYAVFCLKKKNKCKQIR